MAFVRGAVVACLVLVCVLLGAPAAAGVPSLPVAQERFDQARQRLDDAERRTTASQQRIATAGERLTAARSRLAAAQRAYDARRTTSVRAAADARAATLAKNAADEVAEQASAALHRLARSAYMHSSTGGELAVMVGAATGGPGVLADYASGDLAVERVQGRIVAEAQASAAAAGSAATTYTDATSAYAAALQQLEAYRVAVVEARHEVVAASTESHLAAAAYRSAQQTRDRAADVFTRSRAVLAQARRAAARRAATTPGTVAPVPIRDPGSSGNQAVTVWQILRSNGFSEAAAAGILGNLQQESNIDPTTVQFDGPGMGLAQWSRGGRWDTGPNSLLAYAAAAGLDPWDVRTQTRFMIVEMSASWGGFDLARFRGMTDVVAAAVYFHDVYEVSADTPEQVVAVRGGYALQWYAALAK